MKKILYFNFLAIILTYVSLLYQKNILVARIVVDKLEKVEVIAGGFPLQFLIDGETSPVGSVHCRIGSLEKRSNEALKVKVVHCRIGSRPRYDIRHI